MRILRAARAHFSLLTISIAANLLVSAVILGTRGPDFEIFGVIGGVFGAILHKRLNSPASCGLPHSRIREEQVHRNSNTWDIRFDWRSFRYRRDPNLR